MSMSSIRRGEGYLNILRNVDQTNIPVQRVSIRGNGSNPMVKRNKHMLTKLNEVDQ